MVMRTFDGTMHGVASLGAYEVAVKKVKRQRQFR
jgi:hypothetical protein